MVANKNNLERIVSSKERQARKYFVSLVHKEYWHEPNQTRQNHSVANCNLHLSFRKCMDWKMTQPRKNDWYIDISHVILDFMITFST